MAIVESGRMHRIAHLAGIQPPENSQVVPSDRRALVLEHLMGGIQTPLDPLAFMPMSDYTSLQGLCPSNCKCNDVWMKSLCFSVSC